MKTGDYVLASKYSDGDPRDHFCVGFLQSVMKLGSGDRFIVVDSEGVPFRANGFRRAEKISVERGNLIVGAFKYIELSRFSVWHWKKVKLDELKKMGRINIPPRTGASNGS